MSAIRVVCRLRPMPNQQDPKANIQLSGGSNNSNPCVLVTQPERPSVKSQIQELKQLHRRKESASVISAELQAPGGVISRRKPTKANRTVVHHSGPSAPNWGGVSYPRFPGVGYPSLPRMVAHMLSPITSPARAEALTSASVFAAEAAATVHPPAATSAFSCPDIQPQYPTNTIKLGSCSVDVDQGGRSGGSPRGGMNDHLR